MRERYLFGCHLLFLPLLFGCGRSKPIQASDQLAQAAQEQSSQIVVGENTPVVKDSARVFTEPYVVANPSNPAHLLVGGISGTYPEGGWTSNCTSFVSFDGGRHWNEHRFPTDQCSDPWVVLLGHGTALFSCIGPNGIEVFRSEDGGRNWPDKPTSVLPALDHPVIVTKPGSTVDIYVTGERGTRDESRTGPFVARSIDDGRSFQVVARFLPNEFQNSVGAPVFLSNGILVLPLSSYAKSSGAIPEPEFLNPRTEWIVTSKDRGKTFSNPIAITKSCVSKAGFPSLVVDQTKGTFLDRLYYVCIGSESKQTIVHHSSDGGITWQGPIVVSSAKENVVFRRTPSIVINNEGIVGVSWYERVHEGSKCLQDVYFTASTDGGRTFLPPKEVTSASPCPDTTGNGQAAVRFPAGGDYSGLTASSDSLFRVVWADSRNGTYQLFTATVRVNEVKRPLN